MNEIWYLHTANLFIFEVSNESLPAVLSNWFYIMFGSKMTYWNLWKWFHYHCNILCIWDLCAVLVRCLKKMIRVHKISTWHVVFSILLFLFSESSKLMNIHKLGEVYLISCFVLKRTCETFVYNNNNTTSSKTFKIWVVQNAQVLIIVAPQTITYHVRINLLKMCHNKETVLVFCGR